MTANKTLIFKKIPTGMPVAGEDLVVEDRGFDADAAPPEGGVTLSILSASFDPYLRGRMRSPLVKSYNEPFPVDTPVKNNTIARVLKSDSPNYAPGDAVVAFLPIAEYAVLTKEQLVAISRKIDNKYGLKPLSLWLGPLGMPGLTAYSSLHEIGQPKAGETIFISSAAGAVGQIVGQVAKREGLRVIGSVGSDDKLDFILKDLGFDAGFNYKKESPFDALKRLAPKGVDIYYENVGGEHLDAALENMNFFGRIIACGMISQYSVAADQRYGVKGMMNVVSKRLTMRGFIVGDPGMGPKWAKEHQENLQKWLSEGSVQAKLSIIDGIDNGPTGFIGMLNGENFGKSVLKIKDE